MSSAPPESRRSARSASSVVDIDLLGFDENALKTFLSSRGAQSHLVSSAPMRKAIPADAAGAFTWSESLDDVPDTARTLHIDSPDNELELLREARQRFPDRKVLGLRHHLVPMLSSDRQPLKTVPEKFRIDELKRFVVVSPARAGGTLLNTMLAQTGIGKPREHLRRELAAALRAPGVDRAEIWRQVAWRSADRNVFGTRLLARFLVAAAGEVSVADLLQELAPEGVPVIALRRPIIDTVVSRFVSFVAEQWHVYGAMTPQQKRRFEAPAYDIDELNLLLEANRMENREMEAALARLPAGRVLDIDYADLDADPQAVLQKVAAFIGATPKMSGLDKDRLPIKISAQVGTHARMRERFLADLKLRGDIGADLLVSRP